MLEITEVAPTGTNLAEFVVSPALAATWVDQTCDTRHAYRAARVSILADGTAWVWAHRITKSGIDYKSGEGIHLVLRAGSSPIGAGWNTVTGDLVVELLNRGWSRTTEEGARFPAFRWSRKPVEAAAPKTAREELMTHPAVTLIDAPRDGLSRVEARLVDGGTLPEFVGLLRGDEFLTGDPEGDGYMGVPAEYVRRYLDGVLNARTMPADAWTRSNILLNIMYDAKAPMFQSAGPGFAEPEAPLAGEVAPIPAKRVAELEGSLGNAQAEIAALKAKLTALESRPVLVAVPEAPRLVALFVETTADEVKEGDRLLLINGFPVGYQQPNGEVEPGLLAEHSAPTWDDGYAVWSITVWMGNDMVGLVVDATTKVRVRRAV